MNTKLTDRQNEVLGFLNSFHVNNGQPPSTREIQRHFGYKSQNAVMNHLKALARKDLIEQLGGRVWAAKVQDSNQETVSLPIIGTIRAGHPSPGEQTYGERLNLDLSALGLRTVNPSRLFGLHVHGDSMTSAHILDGDLAVLERKPHRPGDIVAALVDGETTLKRLVVEKNQAYLRAENPNNLRIYPAEQLEIQGVFVGLLRAGSN